MESEKFMEVSFWATGLIVAAVIFVSVLRFRWNRHDKYHVSEIDRLTLSQSGLWWKKFFDSLKIASYSAAIGYLIIGLPLAMLFKRKKDASVSPISLSQVQPILETDSTSIFPVEVQTESEKGSDLPLSKNKISPGGSNLNSGISSLTPAPPFTPISEIVPAPAPALIQVRPTDGTPPSVVRAPRPVMPPSTNRTPVMDAVPARVEVLSGDLVLTQAKSKVRLLGVKTPDQGQDSIHAREELAKILGDGVVKIQFTADHSAALVWRGDLLVNESMIRRGWSRAGEARFTTAEAAAKAKGAGLWSSEGWLGVNP